VISVLGTLFSDIALAITPTIAPVDAARIIEKTADAFIPFGASPTLVIVPSPVGTFALTSKASVAYAIAYYVDAFTASNTLPSNGAETETIAVDHGVKAGLRLSIGAAVRFPPRFWVPSTR